MNWEFDILYAIQSIRNPVLDRIMAVLSDIGNYGIFWIAVAAVLVISKSTDQAGFRCRRRSY